MPHDEVWHQLFDQEETRLRDAIGEFVVAIEHVGSTAICGLSAKPILDIAVAVREITDVLKCVAPLENIDYEYRGELGIPGRHYFTRGEPRTHHVHMVEWTSEFWRTHLLFRDYLRSHPQITNEYHELKQKLAKTHPEDRGAYTDGKSAFIESVLQAASNRR